MKKALDFVLSMEFWRMGLLWTFSLLISYWNLFFAQTSTSSPPSLESRPVCVITGVDKETVSVKCFGRSKRSPYAHVYEHSKLFLLLFSYELHCQLGVMDISPQVSVIVVDPGVVKTNIMREVPPCLSSLPFIVLRLLCLLQSPEVGGSSILDAALASPASFSISTYAALSPVQHWKHLEFTSLVGREGLSALLCFHMIPNLRRNFGIHRLIYF